MSGDELIGKIIQANYNAYADVTQKLLDSYIKENRELQMKLQIIGERLEDLCFQNWAPNPSRVMAALTVHPYLITQRLAELPEEVA